MSEIDLSARPNELMAQFDYGAFPEFASGLQRAAERIRNRTTKCGIENGRELRKWREKLEHGQFGRWVKSECRFSLRTAELVMTVAEYVDSENGKSEIISLLPPTVQYLVAAPTTPQSVRDYVLDRYANGERLKVKYVRQLLLGAKGETKQSAPTGVHTGGLQQPDAQPECGAAEERPSNSDQVVEWPEDGGAGAVQPVDGEPEAHSPADDAWPGYYLEKIIKILGEQVKARGLLIELLKKAGYRDLAQGLRDYDDKQLKAAA